MSSSEPLRALEQHRLAVVERLAEHEADVGDIRAQPVAVAEVLVGDLLRVNAAAVVDLREQLVLVPKRQLKLLGENAGVEQVLDPDAHARDLVAVGRPDAAARGADLRVAEEPLADLVEGAVVRHDQVRAGADQETLAADAACLERVDLLEEHLRVDDDAVADDRDDRRRQHSGRQHVQRVLLLADDDRVPGVIAALVPDDVLDAVPEQVGRLALTLVAPLGTDQHDRRHLLQPFTRRKPLTAQVRQGLLPHEITRKTQVKPRPG